MPKTLDIIRSEERSDWDLNAEFYRGDDGSALMNDLSLRRERYYEIDPGQRVLDLGCGSGGVVAQLRARGIDAVGTDYAPAMVRIAREAYGLGQHIQCAEATALPFEDDSFDVVMANGVFHHLAVQDQLVGTLREIARVLRPGGRLCCFDRNGSLISRLLTHICVGAKEVLRFLTRRDRFASCASRNEPPYGSARDMDVILGEGFTLQRRQDVSSLPFFLGVVTLNAIQYFVSVRLRRFLEAGLVRAMSRLDTICGWRWFCVEQFIVFRARATASEPAPREADAAKQAMPPGTLVGVPG